MRPGAEFGADRDGGGGEADVVELFLVGLDAAAVVFYLNKVGVDAVDGWR